MRSTWEDREIPVLVAVAGVEEQDIDEVEVGGIVERTGLSVADAIKSVRALCEAQPPYLTAIPIEVGELYTPVRYLDIRLTERGRRTVRVWPEGDSLQEFVQTVRAQIDRELDPKQKSRWERLLAAVTEIGTGAAAGFLADFLKRMSGVA